MFLSQSRCVGLVERAFMQAEYVQVGGAVVGVDDWRGKSEFGCALVP